MTFTEFKVAEYDLAATLDCGQAFRWELREEGWEGVILGRWVRLSQSGATLRAATIRDPGDWAWLREYLGLEEDLDAIRATFPADPVLRAAAEACRGMHLLRQEPWECLASFILSSTKQIVQIRAIIGSLSARYGERVAGPGRGPEAFAFPGAERLAGVSEAELRESKMGFRARYLQAAAAEVASGRLNLETLRGAALEEARAALMALPGVGRKIADCVLLFSLGFTRAFPVDVWVSRALRELYFPRRRPPARRILEFSERHFGPWGGYAQQCLFHATRRRLLPAGF